MVPVRVLVERTKLVRDVRSPISVLRVPDMVLFERTRLVREVRSPISVLRVPDIPAPEMVLRRRRKRRKRKKKKEKKKKMGKLEGSIRRMGQNLQRGHFS